MLILHAAISERMNVKRADKLGTVVQLDFDTIAANNAETLGFV